MKNAALFLTLAFIVNFAIKAQDNKSKSAYNYQENADKLFNRAKISKDYERTNPEMAY